MSLIKSPGEIEIMREGGRRHARILRLLKEYTKVGMTTMDVDKYAESLVRENGDIPSFKNYKPHGAKKMFPASLCISINDEVVHGIPGDRVIKEGDVISIDLGLTHKNLVTDSAITFVVGREATGRVKELLKATEEGLWAGINAAKIDGHVGDISAAIEEVQRKYRFGNIRELGGHGVGHGVHEDPFVPNYGRKGTGAQLKKGMVLALEPMFILDGTEDIRQMPDGYTIITHSGAVAAHCEHTIAFTENGVEVLTME
jgi:methionyl aminopeptidase